MQYICFFLQNDLYKGSLEPITVRCFIAESAEKTPMGWGIQHKASGSYSKGSKLAGVASYQVRNFTPSVSSTRPN
mgnify:CR=1 FL=1